MKFTGKQIRVKLSCGKMETFRGSAYTLRIYDCGDTNYNVVQVFFNGTEEAWWDFSDVDSVEESQFTTEIIK